MVSVLRPLTSVLCLLAFVSFLSLWFKVFSKSLCPALFRHPRKIGQTAQVLSHLFDDVRLNQAGFFLGYA